MTVSDAEVNKLRADLALAVQNLAAITGQVRLLASQQNDLAFQLASGIVVRRRVLSATPFIPQGYGVVAVAGGVRIADATGLSMVTLPSGVTIAGAQPDEYVYIATGGVRPASETGLGGGVADVVGQDITGKLVRASDPACIPGFYYGACNTVGDLTINVRPSLSENIGDGRFTLTTANATPTTIATITIADETVVAIEAYCEAKLAGSGTVAFIAKRDVYKRTAAGAPAQVDPVEVLTKRPAATPYDVTFVPSGNTVLVKVTGATNVKWTAEVKALKLSDG